MIIISLLYTSSLETERLFRLTNVFLFIDYDWNYNAFDEGRHYCISLKKAIAKIRKRATFKNLPLDDKLFLSCSIFTANSTGVYITNVV